jgi:hypothetical protein
MIDEIDYSTLEREAEKPIGEGGALFCGVTAQQFAIDGVTYQWPRGSKLKWALDSETMAKGYGQLKADDIISCIKLFLKNEFDSNCDVFHEFVSSSASANIILTRHRHDGPSGVLADMQIPANARVDSTQLIGRFDISENWVLAENPPAGTIDFERTCKHEWEHAMGLGHRPPSVTKPALIAPLYSPTMRNLQKADIDELVRRYGTPQQAPTPPVGSRKPVNYTSVVEIEQNGLKWKGSVTGILTPAV